MANHTEVITVTTTATLLTGQRVADGYEQSICVEFITGSDVYIGGPDVLATGTTHLGKKINASRTEFSVKTDGPLYAIVGSSTATVHVFRTFN